jgi:uncharacterized protein (DUF39 family)
LQNLNIFCNFNKKTKQNKTKQKTEENQIMAKTIADINKKIASGDVCVVTAEEMADIVDDVGAEKAALEVDVVTTGTFGAMCSSGVFLNFGHSEVPIKITKMFMNNVEAYSGIAAVDAYLGATQISEK